MPTCAGTHKTIIWTDHTHNYRLSPSQSFLYKFKSSQNNKNLDFTKPKEFADNKIKVTLQVKSTLRWVENIVGKGENVG